MNRRLPLLGAVLVLGGIGGLLPQVAPQGWSFLVQLAICPMVTLSGLSALWLARHQGAIGATKLFFWSSLLALTLILLLGFLEMFLQMSSVRSYGFFHVVTTLLMFLGAPPMWGAAQARRLDPGNLDAQKAGRLSAGAVQLGFFFLFAAEAHRFTRFPFSDQTGSSVATAIFALLQLVQLAERILLLWASIDSVRTAVDDEMILRRALRIDRLMGGWLLLGALSAILSHAYSLAASAGSGPALSTYVWRSAVLLPLTFAIALAVSNRLSVRNEGPKTVASGTPSTGAET